MLVLWSEIVVCLKIVFFFGFFLVNFVDRVIIYSCYFIEARVI